MISGSFRENKYRQIKGGLEVLAEFENQSFDIIFCHNVFEYIENKEPVVLELMRVLKTKGILSIVKHNRTGRVFKTAVLKEDPQKALSLLDSNAKDKNDYLGTQHIYSNEYISALAENYGGKIKEIFGIGAFYAMCQKDSVQYTGQWYKNMLALENAVAGVSEYKDMAFLNHLIIEKYQ